MRLVHILLALVIMAFASSSAFAGDSSLDAARARWETLTPKDQARLRERFDRLRSMPERERAVLEDRARSFAEALRRVETKLDPKDRERIERLDPERRRALLHDLALVEGGERFAKAHGSTPEAWRARFERLPAEERGRILGEMREKMRRQGREKLGEMLSRKFGLSSEEITRLEALPEEERAIEFMRLKRLADERAAKLRATENRGTQRPDEAALLARRQVFEAGRPRSADHLRYAELPPAERRGLVGRILKQRVISKLREQRLANETEIAELDALGHEEFRRAIRDRFQSPHGDRGSKSERPPARDR